MHPCEGKWERDAAFIIAIQFLKSEAAYDMHYVDVGFFVPFAYVIRLIWTPPGLARDISSFDDT